ncbi:MAG TPA: DNA-3-methyladenine glycosylase 2 family protein [Marmoricola sp.]|nr:DNA-3-methyladenine glycosylase 2 family protein [Marmoricola sp.]
MIVAPRTRTWRPGWPCPVGQVLGAHRRGAGDPTYRVLADGAHARAIRTPVGPVALAVAAHAGTGEVTGRAWGPGADWALDRLPRMLGADDDPAGFEPPAALAAAWRRHRHWRLGATDLVMESLVPSILEQKVTGQEAFAGFRRLVRRYGEPAPGPDLGLWIQPDAPTLRQVPSWEWLRLPVDGGRSRPLLAAARVATSLERAGALSHAEFDRRLRTLPGIGVWTSAEVRSRALGDADAVSFGDYHVAKDVGWALAGEPVDDDGLAELLEPFRPHRHRIQYLVAAERLGPPRRGPRMAPRTHLPARAHR